MRLIQVLTILFSCYLSIQSFCYVLSVPISCFKKVVFPLHLVVNLSLCSLQWHTDRIFFYYFERSHSACIVWFCPGIFWVFLHQYLLVYFFQLYCQSCLLLSFFVWSFHFMYFSSFSLLICFCSFFICPSSLIIPILLLENFAPA